MKSIWKHYQGRSIISRDMDQVAHTVRPKNCRKTEWLRQIHGPCSPA